MNRYEVPTVQEFQALRQYLVTHGMATSIVTVALGNAPNGRAIGTIADDLRARLRASPKAPAPMLPATPPPLPIPA